MLDREFCKNLGNFFKCISWVGFDRKSGLPCLTHYTLMSTIRSLGFTISSWGIAIRFKYEEKIPQFLCRGES
jgi:hypothetical protein